MREDKKSRAEKHAGVGSGQWAGLGLGALILFHAAMNLWWLHADNHVIRTDEEVHMTMARKYYTVTMVGPWQGPADWSSRMGNVALDIPIHPPLLHYTGAAVMAVFGYGTKVMAFISTVMFALILLPSWLIARRFLKPWEALFATFVVSFTPLFFVSSRYFMTDVMSTALTTWAIYTLLRSDRFRHSGWALAFGVLAGLGVLSRSITFLYFLLPFTFVVLSGLYSAVRLWRRGGPYRPVLIRVVANSLLCAVVSLGIAAPWYVSHFDSFYTFWWHQHSGQNASPLVFKVAQKPEPKPQAVPAAKPAGEAGPAAKTVKEASPPARKPAPAPGFWASGWKRLIHPAVPWTRYPILVLNNGSFLTLFVLAAFGLPLALALRRFRSPEALLLIVWLLGSWALLTLLFRFGTPRYALQALPAFALFAALPLLALPGVLRYAAVAIVSILLLFQYGNLTIHGYGPLGRVVIPCEAAVAGVTEYKDEGFVVYKDRLNYGFSYAGLGAPTQNNWNDRIFGIIGRIERERGPYLEGEVAHYAKLDYRGLVFHEKHFWPPPNPFQRKDIPPEAKQIRQLRCRLYTRRLDLLEDVLPEVDYVVYAVEGADEKEAGKRQAFLAQRGFEVLETFRTAGFGKVADRIYGVAARRLSEEAAAPVTRKNIEGYDMAATYRLIHTRRFEALPPDLKEYARQRLESLIAAKSPGVQPINEAIAFVAATVDEGPAEGKYCLQFVFRCEQPVEQDWRLFFHGVVREEHLGYLPEAHQPNGFMAWNFEPDPPTSLWIQGEYYILSKCIEPEKIPYAMRVGFFRKGAYFGRGVELGAIDFGAPLP